MSKPRSIAAALKRLKREIIDDVSISNDVSLIIRALEHVSDYAEHCDDSDGHPIYQLWLDADWQAKDFFAALSEALHNEE